MSDLRNEIKEISIWAYEYFIGEDYDGTDINIKGAVETFSKRLHNKILNLKMKVKCPDMEMLAYKDGCICDAKLCKETGYIKKTLKEWWGE